MAENIKRHITHIKSKVTETGKPKLPTASQIELGELAINYAKGVETISTKNDSGTVVTFSSDNYYTEQKLGSGFTGTNSAKTVTEIIEENEEITASAINDLEDRKAEKTELATIAEGKVDKVSGKGLSTNDFTDALKTKLNGIATGAEVNQNAFSNVKVGSTTVAADTKTDTLELSAGTFVSLTPDATNDKVTIGVSTGTSSSTLARGDHSHVSSSITGMTSYSKPSTTSAIATGDTLNAAIGKLEKALDGKQASGSYVTTSRKVSTASGLTGGGDLSADRTIGLAATGTAGTYKQVVVDAYGRVTSGNTADNNSWRSIKVNGTNFLTDTSTALNLSAGTNVTLTTGSTGLLTISATDTTYSVMSAAEVSGGTATSKRVIRADYLKTGLDAVYQAKGSYLTGTTKYAGASTQGGAATSADKLNSNAGSATNPIYFSNGIPSACTYSLNKTVPADAVFTDTNTKVTAVGNHYTPTATSANTKSATASSTAELAWGSAVVTGVTLSGDAAGHITSVTLASGKLKTPVTGVTLASGTNNGTVKLTVNGSATDNIAVKGLGTAAYKAEGYFAGSGHTHTNMVTGSGLTSNDIILGNGSSAIKASGKSIETSLSSTLDTKVPTSKAVADYVTSQMTSVLTYKGAISSNNTLKNAHKVGDTYVVSSAGTYAGKACEVGDYLIANTARASASTVTNADWDAINGENQVENKSASLAAAGSSTTIATVDGTNLTITTPSTWTGVAKTGTVTKISTASGITGGDITTSGTIGLAAVGTAGTYYRVVVDSYGRVTSGNTTDANTNYYTTGLTVSTATTSNTITVKGNNSAVTGTAVLSSATTSAAGLMSKDDKTKLNTVANLTGNASTLSAITATSTAINSLTGSVGTMAFQNTGSYSSATQVNTALSGKSGTGHTHASSGVTAMTGYAIASASGAVATSDSLNTAIGKLEKRIALLEAALGGAKIKIMSASDYDALTTKDSNTLYIINN